MFFRDLFIATVEIRRGSAINNDLRFSPNPFAGCKMAFASKNHTRNNYYFSAKNICLGTQKNRVTENDFHMSQPKLMLWVLKRTVSMRRFF